MSKAERFILDYTRNCSNEIIRNNNDSFTNIPKKGEYCPWLTPDQARRAVEIAREETIKYVCEWIKKNVYSYTWCEFQQHERGVETGKLIEDLKKHFEGKK